MDIVLVEDDPAQSLWVQQILAGGGHRLHSVDSGEALLAAGLHQQCQLLLVDWELPGMSGYDIVRHIRQHNDVLPIMFVTSRSLEEDIVSGLAAGANDYLVKPVSPSLLLARAFAHLQPPVSDPVGSTAMEIVGYRVKPDRACIEFHGEPIEIQPHEYRLACQLLANFGRIVPRTQLLNTIAQAAPSALDSSLSALRQKLGFRPQNGLRISSIFTYGYRLERFPP
jgi:two-component system phosphate regulon response regulator PhoB